MFRRDEGRLLTADRVPSRVLIEGVTPEIDGGLFPAKRAVGEPVAVGADIFADGHEVLAAICRYRHESDAVWTETPMVLGVNDHWTTAFVAAEMGWYEFTVQAWIDPFATWRRDLQKRVAAQQDVHVELLDGAALLNRIAGTASKADAAWLIERSESLSNGDMTSRIRAATDEVLLSIAARSIDRSPGHTYEKTLRVWVDRERARFGAWYELFPRSCAAEPGRHGTLRDLAQRLPSIAAMNFDVVYLPPIHPIGRQFRKGPNNTLKAGPDDPGSPWAIGGPEGGHKSIHPQLGTLDDFDELLARAASLDLEIAMDIAFQCSPDHPYVSEHPDWFRHRVDGTIRYAENPPKKYQDIYPIDFECADWKNLWNELLSVVQFWAKRGVRIFRVDNPHTKPFRFWAWLIEQIHRDYPDALFLAEAFTRPKLMKHLAKSGFTQSYSYFTWRNTRWEIEQYFEELTQPPVIDYMRPNLFANTPDILPEYLQHGGPAAFPIRLVLAATLGANYGIYGPPFELFQSTPRPGSEEYIDNEKYELKHWDWDSPNVFREFIALVNRIRRDNPALQFDRGLQFHSTDNEQLLFFSKTSPDRSNTILVVVNVDPHHTQAGYLQVPLADFHLGPRDTYQVQDLLTGAHFLWQGERNFVSLDPRSNCAHILRLRTKVRTEFDFDYFQ
jgi:starch synthase (maltosyl-transferring)